MYEVVILLERPLADEDAQMVDDLYGEVERETHLHVLLPADEHDTTFVARATARFEGAAAHAATDASSAAAEGLDRTLARLRARNLDADGEVVGGDPLDALRDTVRTRGSEEVVIITRPHVLTETMRLDWTSKARRMLNVPLLHLLEHAEG